MDWPGTGWANPTGHVAVPATRRTHAGYEHTNERLGAE